MRHACISGLLEREQAASALVSLTCADPLSPLLLPKLRRPKSDSCKKTRSFISGPQKRGDQSQVSKSQRWTEPTPSACTAHVGLSALVEALRREWVRTILGAEQDRPPGSTEAVNAQLCSQLQQLFSFFSVSFLLN